MSVVRMDTINLEESLEEFNFRYLESYNQVLDAMPSPHFQQPNHTRDSEPISLQQLSLSSPLLDPQEFTATNSSSTQVPAARSPSPQPIPAIKPKNNSNAIDIYNDQISPKAKVSFSKPVRPPIKPSVTIASVDNYSRFQRSLSVPSKPSATTKSRKKSIDAASKKARRASIASGTSGISSQHHRKSSSTSSTNLSPKFVGKPKAKQKPCKSASPVKGSAPEPILDDQMTNKINEFNEPAKSGNEQTNTTQPLLTVRSAPSVPTLSSIEPGADGVGQPTFEDLLFTMDFNSNDLMMLNQDTPDLFTNNDDTLLPATKNLSNFSLKPESDPPASSYLAAPKGFDLRSQFVSSETSLSSFDSLDFSTNNLIDAKVLDFDPTFSNEGLTSLYEFTTVFDEN